MANRGPPLSTFGTQSLVSNDLGFSFLLGMFSLSRSFLLASVAIPLSAVALTLLLLFCRCFISIVLLFPGANNLREEFVDDVYFRKADDSCTHSLRIYFVDLSKWPERLQHFLVGREQYRLPALPVIVRARYLISAVF